MSALRYGHVLVRTPINAISSAWGVAVCPALVRSASETPRSGLADATDRSMRYVVAIFVPLAMLTAAVAPVAIAVAHGAAR